MKTTTVIDHPLDFNYFFLRMEIIHMWYLISWHNTLLEINISYSLTKFLIYINKHKILNSDFLS